MDATITRDMVRQQRQWVLDRDMVVVPLINDVRDSLGDVFETTVPPVGISEYHSAVRTIFTEGDVAVNVAALVIILREIDVPNDYPGFIVDEILGRELAGMIAGQQPLRLLGEATFHYADVMHHRADESAGMDDLDAALAAGFQTRLPGWKWTEAESPFTIAQTDP